jgi:hypothetical protein
LPAANFGYKQVMKRDEQTEQPGASRRASGAMPEEEVDALYGLPLEQFTKSRNQLARDLRSRGERAAADWVTGQAKPSRAAWAVNQVMRTQRKDARALLEASENLRKAHERVAAGSASAEDLREAVGAERAAVERLSRAARGLITETGRPLSENILDRVTQTLHAISADSEVRSLAQAGRLSREQRATGTEALTASRPKQRRNAGRGRPSQAKLREARERLARAQREVRDLRSVRTGAAKATSNAERSLARARADMRAAERRVASKESEIEKLRRRLDELK